MRHRGRIEIMIMVFVFGFIALGFNACTEANVESKHTGIVIEDGKAPIKEVVIEGCEYFYKDAESRFGLTHKGNCSNPIHCHNGGNEGGEEILLNTTNRVDV